MFLEHVNLTVKDLNRSIDFYRDLLGMEIRWQGKTTDGKLAAHIGDEKCYLALFQAPIAGSTIGKRNYDEVGFNHFGFVVDDLDTLRKQLIDQGITPHLEADYEPGKRLYFIDPDGFEVELVQYDSAPITN